MVSEDITVGLFEATHVTPPCCSVNKPKRLIGFPRVNSGGIMLCLVEEPIKDDADIRSQGRNSSSAGYVTSSLITVIEKANFLYPRERSAD